MHQAVSLTIGLERLEMGLGAVEMKRHEPRSLNTVAGNGGRSVSTVCLIAYYAILDQARIHKSVFVCSRTFLDTF